MDSENTSAPMHETGPGGGSPEGDTGPVIPSLSGGHSDEYERLVAERQAFVNRAHAVERAVGFLEGELLRWQAAGLAEGRLSILITDTLAKSAFLRAGWRIDRWDHDCGCDREHPYAWDRCTNCGGVVPLFERGFRREVA